MRNIRNKENYDIVTEEINALDPLRLFAMGVPFDEYDGEISNISNKIRRNNSLKYIERTLFEEFGDLDIGDAPIEQIKYTAYKIYKRINICNDAHPITKGLTLFNNLDPDEHFFIPSDMRNLKIGDLCNVSDIFRAFDRKEYFKNYKEKLINKVVKITREYILFSSVEDKYKEQEMLHYYDKKSNTFYKLEHCRHDRWIVIKWLLNINYPGLISEQVINWFNVTGSRTPEHILECAKKWDVFETN